MQARAVFANTESCLVRALFVRPPPPPRTRPPHGIYYRRAAALQPTTTSSNGGQSAPLNGQSAPKSRNADLDGTADATTDANAKTHPSPRSAHCSYTNMQQRAKSNDQERCASPLHEAKKQERNSARQKSRDSHSGSMRQTTTSTRCCVADTSILGSR